MTLRFGILTVSDRSSRGERVDISGPALVEAIQGLNYLVEKTAIAADEVDEICKILIEWSDSRDVDIILSTGGTGFAPRDVTPEATRLVIERLTPGLDEAIRAKALLITPHAMLSRAVSGIRGNTLIINLPGSPKAAVENFSVVIPVLEHAIQLLQNNPESERGH